MSAVAGIINLDTDKWTLAEMLKTMQARGSAWQESGTYGRCMLLQAESVSRKHPHEKQPLTRNLGGEDWTIVLDGQLYNRRELQDQLRALGNYFPGKNDAETILNSYVQWGINCLDRFNGVFSFAIWNHCRGELFLARDRIGVKPLFYSLKRNGIIFASEPKTILAHPEFPAELDSRGAVEILLLGPGRNPGSGVFRGISELEPGCWGLFQNEKFTTHRYWKLSDRIHSQNFEETVEIVRNLVIDSIHRQTNSERSVGTFLSGGLDSSLISAVCAHQTGEQGRILNTFSVDYENNDHFFHPTKFQPNSDPYYISLMIQTLQSNHHWTVLSPKDLIHSLKEATLARDLPGMADIDSSLYLFCREVRKYTEIAISGECADEIFGGYPWYRDPEIRTQDGFPWAQNTKYRIDFLNPDFKSQFEPEDYIRAAYEKTLKESDILPENNPTDFRMKEMTNLNFRWFMQTLLDRNDRMSMSNGLEVRVPFCDYRIAEYLYSVPWKFKDYHGHEKGLLRKAMEGMLPEPILWRKKSPYPKTFDPGYLTLVKSELERVIEKSQAPILQMVPKKTLQLLLNETNSQPWYGQLMNTPQTIAYMLQINFWLEKYKIRFVC